LWRQRLPISSTYRRCIGCASDWLADAPASSIIRAFLLKRGVAMLRPLRAELPRILATPLDVLTPRMVCIIETLG
jgi:hypothetical protein